jgi:hypothetical protein
VVAVIPPEGDSDIASADAAAMKQVAPLCGRLLRDVARPMTTPPANIPAACLGKLRDFRR